MLSPGQHIAAYEVEQRLGVGGMAEVWRVRHRVLDSLHALKVLRPELTADDELRGRFLAEGRLAARTHHPHIARVTDIVAEDGVAGLVLELLAGGTLEARLAAREGQGLPPELVVRVLDPVLDALAPLHEQGVVHRDLKAANLLFRDEGWDGVVLTDFGIARLRDGSGAGTHTRTGHLMGTPGSMSPEQVLGREVDARSDLFSIGALAWEMLTGQPAFSGESDFDTMRKVVAGERPLLRVVAPGVPIALAAVVEGCLDVDPSRRPASAQALRAALRDALARPDAVQDSARATPPSVAQGAPAAARPAGCFARSLGCGVMTLLVGASAGFLLLAGALGWVSWAWSAREEGREEARALLGEVEAWAVDPARHDREDLTPLVLRSIMAARGAEEPGVFAVRALVTGLAMRVQADDVAYKHVQLGTWDEALALAAPYGDLPAVAAAMALREAAACRIGAETLPVDAAAPCSGPAAAAGVVSSSWPPWLRHEVLGASTRALLAEAERLSRAGRADAPRAAAEAARSCDALGRDAGGGPVWGPALRTRCQSLGAASSGGRSGSGPSGPSGPNGPNGPNGSNSPNGGGRR